VRLLEERLQAGGWSGQIFLRPTLQAVHQPAEGKPLERVFVQAWDEMNAFLGSRVPHLTVGFSFGGLLAAFSPSPLRLSVCAPWAELSADAIQKAAARPGWRVLQGDQDSVVAPGPNLEVLPDDIPLTLDPHGTHDFDAWMDRIAEWVLASWETFQES
jgi:alpha/beta superfamily hydrolase